MGGWLRSVLASHLHQMHSYFSTGVELSLPLHGLAADLEHTGRKSAASPPGYGCSGADMPCSIWPVQYSLRQPLVNIPATSDTMRLTDCYSITPADVDCVAGWRYMHPQRIRLSPSIMQSTWSSCENTFSFYKLHSDARPVTVRRQILGRRGRQIVPLNFPSA